MGRVAHDVFSKSYEASADLSASQYCFVKPSTGVAGGVSARMALCGANERTFGVLQTNPNAIGLAGTVRHAGTTKLKVDGSGTAISVGDPLKSNASGIGVKAGTDKDHVGAIALEASTASGDLIEALIAIYDLAA